MNDHKNLELRMEQVIEQGRLAKAVLMFLDEFLLEQRARILSLIENGDDYKTDSFIADLRALSRFEKKLKKCVQYGEIAEEEQVNASTD